MEILIQILSAGAASAGFSLVYTLHHNIKFNIYGGLLGSISWASFLLVQSFTSNDYAAYFIGSITVAILSELLARIYKVPSTTYLIVGIFPLVPGGSIYNTMLHAVHGENDLFLSQLMITIGISISISLAILFSTTFFNLHKKLTKAK